MTEAIYGGYEAWHPSTYQLSRPNGLSHYVLLIIRTHGEFQINGNSYTAESGDALLIAPHTPYSYGNPHGDYIDDWIHFDTADSALRERLNHIANIPFPIGNIENYTFCIRQILWELSYGHDGYAKENINALFLVIFNHLFAAHESRNDPEIMLPHYSRMQMIRLEITNSFSHSHSIEEHAHKLGISESHFQHLYKKYFGISFQQDLIQTRINHAKYILQSSNLPIQQISESCGYTNEIHFYRQFKKMTGYTPAKYRKNAVQSN